MALKNYCESALDSVNRRGIAHDGPLNVGGLSTVVGKSGAKSVADKHTERRGHVADTAILPVADIDLSRTNEVLSVADTENLAEASRTSSSVADNLSRDARYKIANAEKIRERDKQRKAAARAKKTTLSSGT